MLLHPRRPRGKSVPLLAPRLRSLFTVPAVSFSVAPSLGSSEVLGWKSVKTVHQ